MWLRYFLPIFSKIAVRQTVGGRGAAEGNSKPSKRFSPTVLLPGVVLATSVVATLLLLQPIPESQTMSSYYPRPKATTSASGLRSKWSVVSLVFICMQRSGWHQELHYNVATFRA